MTECLGLVATLSTTYNEPYYIAERFASLDHISNGRAGWNIITTANDDAAYNFGQKTHMEKSRRYERAKEFVDICTELWDGRAIDHRGQFFTVKGALGLPRSPQGWPVMFQAGGSPAGTEFAAMVAEAIFAAQSRLDEARTYRNAVMERMPKYGRSPDTLAILPGLSPIVGSTEAEAKRKEAELDELILPAVGVWMLSEQMQFRLYDYALDAPLPSDDIRSSGQAFTPACRQPHGPRRSRRPDGAGVRQPGGEVPLTRHVRGHRGRSGRSHAALAGERRMRRVQHHAGVVPG